MYAVVFLTLNTMIAEESWGGSLHQAGGLHLERQGKGAEITCSKSMMGLERDHHHLAYLSPPAQGPSSLQRWSPK